MLMNTEIITIDAILTRETLMHLTAFNTFRVLGILQYWTSAQNFEYNFWR